MEAPKACIYMYVPVRNTGCMETLTDSSSCVKRFKGRFQSHQTVLKTGLSLKWPLTYVYVHVQERQRHRQRMYGNTNWFNLLSEFCHLRFPSTITLSYQMIFDPGQASCIPVVKRDRKVYSRSINMGCIREQHNRECANDKIAACMYMKRVDMYVYVCSHWLGFRYSPASHQNDSTVPLLPSAEPVAWLCLHYLVAWHRAWLHPARVRE